MRDTVLLRWRRHRDRDESFTIQRARPAAAVLVEQTSHTARFVAGPPVNLRLARDREPARDLGMSNTVSRQQHDPRPQHQTRFRRRRPNPFLKFVPNTVGHSQWRCSQAQFNQTTLPRNRLRSTQNIRTPRRVFGLDDTSRRLPAPPGVRFLMGQPLAGSCRLLTSYALGVLRDDRLVFGCLHRNHRRMIGVWTSRCDTCRVARA